LQEVLLDLWSTSHAAVLLVTHDVDEAILLSDRIAVMTDGPAATMRAVLEVNLPRPRRREASDDAARFRQMRETVLACLTGDPRAGTVAPFRLPEVPSERYLSRTARPT
jgi:ABC-type nitrate/sulfonate/bicarbonate transport system ATPase subunit